jgi:hypothetical protein
MSAPTTESAHSLGPRALVGVVLLVPVLVGLAWPRSPGRRPGWPRATCRSARLSRNTS